MSLRDKVNASTTPNSPKDTFGVAIELGDMTEQGIKAADNLCASFYAAFNARMENNLAAIRQSVAQKSILIPARQNLLPQSEGSFLDAFYQVDEVADEQ